MQPSRADLEALLKAARQTPPKDVHLQIVDNDIEVLVDGQIVFSAPCNNEFVPEAYRIRREFIRLQRPWQDRKADQ